MHSTTSRFSRLSKGNEDVFRDTYLGRDVTLRALGLEDFGTLFGIRFLSENLHISVCFEVFYYFAKRVLMTMRNVTYERGEEKRERERDIAETTIFSRILRQTISPLSSSLEALEHIVNAYQSTTR